MWVMGIPNFLTFFRISLVPVFILAFYWPNELRYPLATAIFAIAAATDWLDGYLARKLKQVSSIGAFLDPVADKLIVVVALVLLVESHNNLLISIATVVIVCREITVSALREWMAKIGQRTKVEVSCWGKTKTFMQMLAILILLSQAPQLVNKLTIVGYITLIIATILAVWSMCQYLYLAWQECKKILN